MRKNIMRLFVAAMLTVIMACCFSVTSYAASASLWFTDPTVQVGSNVSVTVDVKGDDIGGYEMHLSFDTAYLDFLSASGGSNFSYQSNSPGVLRVVDYMSSGSSAKMSFTLTFKTKKTGTTRINPSGYVFSDGGGTPITPYAVGYSEIKIIPVPQASSDATLKGLTMSGGTLSPAFSANVYNYTANVDFSVTSVAVTALKNHNGASVYVSGTESLAVGENTVTITVTAENGAKQNYYIKVTRGKNPLSTDVFLTVGEGKRGEVSKTISGDIVPRGFEATTITLNGVEVGAVKYADNAKPAVYLLGSDTVNAGLYYVDAANMTASPIEYLGPAVSSLLVLDINTAEIPEGYEIGTFSVNGAQREVLVPSRAEEPNHCLVYAIGSAGTKQLYMYDPIEKSFQRYSFAEMGEPETTEEETETTSPETEPETPEITESQEKETQPTEKSEGGFGMFVWILIIIGALIVILGGIALIMGFRQS
ncbi:MAG: cadherin-like beta sandwich domain-containing protein [Clostridia bacterium]|nr:cadherin-like beta sandwich domain-containing protein [Clostridia bacterium]